MAVSLEMIATGGILDIHTIGDYDDRFAEGDEGMVDLEFDHMPDSLFIDALEQGLLAAGVTLTRGLELVEGSAHVKVWFRKEVPAVPVIAGVLVAIGIATLLIFVGWGLFKVISKVDPTILGWQMIAAISIIVIGLLIATVLIARSGKVQAGRVTVGK